MPARILIVKGQKAGAVSWIEDEVVRIGSDPLCEVRLDDPVVPRHAATLEFSGGRYTLHNRCGRPLRLDGLEVAEGESSPWAGGRDLDLADGLKVRLVVDPDPAPAKRPVESAPDDDEEAATPQADGGDDTDHEEEDDADAGGSAAKTVGQIVVTLLCVAAIPVLLNYDKSRGGAGAPAEKAHATFESLAKEILNDPSSDAPGLKAILATLQDARIAELRGKKTEARADLVRALEAAEARKPAGGGDRAGPDGAVDDYIRERLKNLAASSP